jgi:hypothetical protein
LCLFFLRFLDECLDARKLGLHVSIPPGYAAAARKADIRDMAENGSPDDPAEHVVETNTQEKDEAANGVQDDVQAMEAGEESKSGGAEARKEATREDYQGAMKTAKQEEKPQPSKLKVMWGKLGLDPITLILMFK